MFLHCVCLCVCVGGRPQKSGRQSDSRPTASWCSYSRKHSRRLSTSRSPQILCAYRTPPCWLCRTCNPGPKTQPRSAAWPPVSKESARLHQMISFHHETEDMCFGWGPQHCALIVGGPQSGCFRGVDQEPDAQTRLILEHFQGVFADLCSPGTCRKPSVE